MRDEKCPYCGEDNIWDNNMRPLPLYETFPCYGCKKPLWFYVFANPEGGWMVHTYTVEDFLELHEVDYDTKTVKRK